MQDTRDNRQETSPPKGYFAQIFSGLTRVCWELAPVRKGGGGTSFLSSHKAHFSYGGPDPWAANVGGSPC